MKRSVIVAAVCLAAAAALLIAVSASLMSKNHNSPLSDMKSEEPATEEWFTDSVPDENFDFGLDETWIDLNDMEYLITDKLKCYLFIGTDHSGNEFATDDTYKGSMADFLLLAVLNKTDKTYGFLQLNRDTITDVMILNTDGEITGSSQEQLCTAHWYGGSRQQSCLNTVEAVSGLLGSLPVDGYYSVGMDEIAQLNHVIGGATVTIEDDFSKVDPTLVRGETITLSDEQAYNFLHARMDVGDGENESRMRRQRAYMEAVYDKVIDRVRDEKNFLDDITDTLGDSVTTDMNGDDFGQIRNLFRDGKDLGIHVPEGSTQLGMRLDDGIEHTEFYMDEASLARILTLLCDLQVDDFSDFDSLETETEIWS